MGDFYVTITDPACAREFEECLGTTTVPVKSLIPLQCSTPGMENMLFYQMDISSLSESQIDRLAVHIAKKFRLPFDTVKDDLIGNHGLPILSKHCSIVIENPQRWIG